MYKKKLGVEPADIQGLQAVAVWNNPEEEKKVKKTLNDVIKFLSNLKLPKKAKFDFSVIGQHPDDHEPPEKNHCGTAACAVGWMGLKKYKGLKSQWEERGGGYWGLFVYDETGANYFEAVANKLNMDKDAVTWLFDTPFYTNPYGLRFDMEVTREAVIARVKYMRDYGVYYKKFTY